MENADENKHGGDKAPNDSSESSRVKFESEESNLNQVITEDTHNNNNNNNPLGQASTPPEEDSLESGDSSVKSQSRSPDISETLELKPETCTVRKPVYEEEEKKDEPRFGEIKDQHEDQTEYENMVESKSMPENEANLTEPKQLRRSSSGDGNILPDYEKLMNMMNKVSSSSSNNDDQENKAARIESEDTLIIANIQSSNVEKVEFTDQEVDNHVHNRIESPSTDNSSEIQMSLSKADISEVNSLVSDENSEDQNMNQLVQMQETTSLSIKSKSQTSAGTPQSTVSVGSIRGNTSVGSVRANVSASQSVAQDQAEIPSKGVHSATSFASIDQNGQIVFMPNQPIMMPQIQAPLQVNYLHQPLGVPPSAFSQTPPIQQVSPAYNGTPMKKPMQYQTQPTRRKMELHLVEERRIMQEDHEKKSLFSIIRHKSSSNGMSIDDDLISPDSSKFSLSMINHGVISVSWFEGTTTIELEEHVLKSVQRKLELGSKRIIKNIRLLDDRINPPEGERLVGEFNPYYLTLSPHCHNFSFCC